MTVWRIDRLPIPLPLSFLSAVVELLTQHDKLFPRAVDAITDEKLKLNKKQNKRKNKQQKNKNKTKKTMPGTFLPGDLTSITLSSLVAELLNQSQALARPITLPL